MNRKQLEQRLTQFAVTIIEIADTMPNTFASRHLSGQLIRSGTSPALNYGEAQSAESKKDFIHKLSIALKELRESVVCMNIILHSKSYGTETKLQDAITECNELISIFYRSIQTARKKKRD